MLYDSRKFPAKMSDKEYEVKPDYSNQILLFGLSVVAVLAVVIYNLI